MAKYLGLITADARGKFGGAVLTRAQTGTTIRRKSSGAQPRTPLQSQQRQRFAFIGSQWKAQSNANVLQWQTLAKSTTWTSKLGTPYSPSAQQLFSQCSGNASLNGQAIAITPPSAVPTVYNPSALVISYATLTLTLTYVMPSGAGGTELGLYVYGPFSAGVSSVAITKGRFVGVLLYPYSAVNITPYFPRANFGSGQSWNIKVWLKPWDGDSGWPGAIATAGFNYYQAP